MNMKSANAFLMCSLLAVPGICHAEEFALFIDDSSHVGIGTNLPEAKLHVLDSEYGYNVPFTVENSSGINYSGFRLKIAPDSWIDFSNSGGKFRINADQTPGSEFEVRPNGDATLSGALTQNSDVNAKKDIVNVDSRQLLAKVVDLPISEWSYKDNPGTRHIGPMAQDFHATFGVGDSPTGISSIDTGGVALAAIKGLKQEKDDQIEQLVRENANLRQQLQEQSQRMLTLELALNKLMHGSSLESQVADRH